MTMKTADIDVGGGAAAAMPHPLLDTWRHFRRNRGAMIGLVVICMIAFAAVFADLLAPHHPYQQHRDDLLAPPFWAAPQTLDIEIAYTVAGPGGEIAEETVTVRVSAGPDGAMAETDLPFTAREDAGTGAIAIDVLGQARSGYTLAEPRLVTGRGIPAVEDGVLTYVPARAYADLRQGGSSRFILGTDDLGRDILSRLIHGARLSMLIGVIVVTLSLAAGVMLGLIAGYFRGIVEIVIMRVMDMMLAMPALLLAIVIVAALGPSLTNAIMAIAIIVLPHYVRLTRASVINEMGKDYVTASRVAGAGGLRLMVFTVLPNCVAPLIVQATLGFSSAILDAAALGFLGLGAQPPIPEWGSMLSNTLQFIRRAWWVVTFPGLAILITVLAFNLLGDGLRDALDPKLKR